MDRKHRAGALGRIPRRALAFPLLAVLAVSSLPGSTRLSVFANTKSTRAAKPTMVVKMADVQFLPERVTVEPGQTVEWSNDSVLVHTVTADPELAAQPEHVALPKGAQPFDSGNIDPGGTFQRTFTVPGTYRYFCIPHEAAGMVGEIEVVPSGGEKSRGGL